MPDDAFRPELLEELIARDPDQFLVDVERDLVAQHGLSMFIRLGWHAIEGSEASYRSNWHIDAICEHLEAVSRGELKRLLVAVPPRHMKSISVAVMWPAWDWLTTPHRRFLFASYAHTLSIRDSTRCRRVIQSPWYQARWGDKFRLTEDQNTKVRFENNRNGYRLSTSVGGTLTGEGGDIVVVDDPLNVSDADSDAVREAALLWWDEAMSTRLNDPKTGAYVVIQQRVHQRDLIGHLLRKSGNPYTYLCLPAEYEPDHPNRWFRDPRTEAGELLWAEHVPRPQIEELKTSLGAYASAGQLQQRPAPREGGIFKEGWFEIVDTFPEDCMWARGWDLAASRKQVVKADPDYTATVLIGFSYSQQRFYIADAARWREDAHEIENLMQRKAEGDPTGTMIEIPQDPGQAGKAQAQRLLTLLAKYSAYASPVNGDKLVRASAWAGKAGGGLIKMVRASWNAEFMAELTGFPNFDHDDWVDAASSAMERLVNSTFGIMEFYRRESEDAAQRRAELERLKQQAAAAGPLEFPGSSQLVRQPTVEEYQKALFGEQKE